MSFITLIFLSLSLSADAFAVAVSAGISQKNIRITQALSMAVCFGFFQAIMPAIGYSIASLFAEAIRDYDHWIAFFLLAYIGGSMIYAGWKGGDTGGVEKNIFSLRSLLTLGLATSIDALAVGVSLTASESSIIFPALIIGLITGIVSYIGVGFGKKFSHHIGSRAEIIGGAILIIIGTRILISHVFS